MIPVYLLVYGSGSAEIVPQANHSLFVNSGGRVTVQRGREFSETPDELYLCDSPAQALAVLAKDPADRASAATRIDLTLKASPRHGTSAEASDNPSGAAPAAPAAPEGTARD